MPTAATHTTTRRHSNTSMKEHESIEKILFADRAPLSDDCPSSERLHMLFAKRDRRRKRMKAGTGLTAAFVALGATWSALSREPSEVQPLAESPVQETVNKPVPAMLASDPDPNRWFVGVGPRDASGYYPVMMIDESTRTMFPMGTIQPPVVKERSVWQLPGEVREKVLTNWAEAGHAVVHEL